MNKIIVLFLVFFSGIYLHAGIMIYPKYLLFKERVKSAEIILINPSKTDPSTYRVSITYKQQNHDGSYTEITSDKQPQFSAVPFLRFSPRSVELEPKKSQTIRVLKRLPEGLPNGDYVAYITFTEVIKESPRTKQVSNDSQILSIEVTPIPSFSIPIIIRHGSNAGTSAHIEVLPNYNLDKDKLPIRITRQPQESKYSVRGDISIWLNDEIIGMLKGKYVLPSLDYVDALVPLFSDGKPFPLSDLKNKPLKILFTIPKEDGIDKTNIISQIAITL